MNSNLLNPFRFYSKSGRKLRNEKLFLHRQSGRKPNRLSKVKKINKNALYGLLILLAIFLVRRYRLENAPSIVRFAGKTMGTTYSVKYIGKKAGILKQETDSLLELFSRSLSTYIPDSEISRFNAGRSLRFDLPFFLPVLQKSRQIFEAAEGAFDPTVMPLVRAWGFGPGRTPDSLMSQEKIDSLLLFVGFNKIRFSDQKVEKTKPGIELDFSALAKGYAADVLGRMLSEKGIENFMAEIGGEVVCRGRNEKNELWTIGIQTPSETAETNDLSAAVRLENRAMATSGNYRSFYVKDGKKISHTLSPKTGRPVRHSLLSASVIAPDCMTADALATAFMVGGTDFARQYSEARAEIDVVLIYEENGSLKTFVSEGIRKNAVR